MLISFHGEFAQILNNKSDKRYKIWKEHAERQLKLKGCDKTAAYITADDVIFDIITAVLTGTVKWDRKKVPNITTFMFNQIRGYVSNLSTKGLNRVSIYMSCFDSLPFPPRKKTVAEFKDPYETGDITLEQIERLQNQKEFCEKVCKALEDDYIAYFVFEDMVKGYKSHETAKRLGLCIPEVANAKKRVKRVIKRLIEAGEI